MRKLTNLIESFNPITRLRRNNKPDPGLTDLAKKWGTDKWGSHYYTHHYDHHFSPYRHRPITLLEIGVGGAEDPKKGGASLRMWKEYFPLGRIYGLDIHDKSEHEEERIQIYRGSQNDPEFLTKIAKEIGPIDIIIDDGSHINEHVVTSFETLFPFLKEDGIYAVEDTQTSYWPEFGGDSYNLDKPTTIIGYFKRFADKVNYEEIARKDFTPEDVDKIFTSIHFYHNLLFIYKGNNSEGSDFSHRHIY